MARTVRLSAAISPSVPSLSGMTAMLGARDGGSGRAVAADRLADRAGHASRRRHGHWLARLQAVDAV